jgi:hypothetical protein
MASTEHNFESLRTGEIRRLVDVLPPPLSGGAPVSALLFQPTEAGGRLVYLDRDKNAGPENPIHLDPGQVSEKFFFKVDDKNPWSTEDAFAEQAVLDEYCNRNVAEMRLRLAKQDKLRYQLIQYDKDGIVPVGTRYRMHYIVPPPVYHQSIRWWNRLPRLGQIYSLGDQLEHDNLLLICGMSIGIRALAIRLNLLLDHENKVRQTAFQIAGSLASARQVEPDEFHYLLANMLMAHHWFYPYDPLALKIFALLGSDPDRVLNMHGWPSSGLRNFETNSPLDTLLDQLAQDLLFLIYACTIWSAPGDSQRKDSAELYKEVKMGLRTVLALICGTPRYAKVSPMNLKYLDYSAEYICIQPPVALQADKSNSPELPLFSREQLLTKDQNVSQIAQAYLQTLCPSGNQFLVGKWNNFKVCRVQGERPWTERKTLGKWLTLYARARCVMKLMDEDKQ